MKKGRISEEKQVNFFIVAFIVFLVLVVAFVVFMVHNSKSNTQEDESSTTTSVSQSVSMNQHKGTKKSTDASTNVASESKTTEKASNTSTKNSAVNQSSTVKSSSTASSADNESERYRKECEEINTKYNNIISTSESVIRVLEQSQTEDSIKLETMKAELDIMRSAGQSQSAIDDKQFEIEIIQGRIENGKKGIEEQNQKIEKAKADKAAELVAAEKKHQANLK